MKQISDNRILWHRLVTIVGLFLGLRFAGSVIGALFAQVLFSVWLVFNFRLGGVGTIRVTDFGDHLELREGKRVDSVNIENIDRVIYEKHWGTQICRLHLREPCTFGSEVRFVVSQHWVSPEYDPIADDLHRRSKCCKGDEQAL